MAQTPTDESPTLAQSIEEQTRGQQETKAIRDTAKQRAKQDKNLPTKGQDKNAPEAGYGVGLQKLMGQAQGSIPKTPSTTQDIDQLLSSYMNELNNLGPEYGAEMEYLKPYLTPQSQTMQQVVSQANAQASPTGNTALNAANQAVGQAIESQKAPGFGNLAAANQEYAQTLPYDQLLSTLLQAGKNEVLGYSTVPNLTNIQTSGWPQQLQSAYQYAVRGIGYNPVTGIATPTTAATQAQQQQNQTPQASLTGGGSTG